MRKILAVDGYNIIHAWGELREWMEKAGLEAARDRLCDAVQDYAASAGINAVVVFDAMHTQKAPRKKDVQHNIEIVYTVAGETADAYIERLAYELDEMDCELLVATADGTEQLMILGRGATRVTPRELMEDMRAHRRERVSVQKGRQGLIEDRLPKGTLEALERIRKGENL